MTYDAQFFSENRGIALPAAEIILPPLIKEIEASYVIDVGCGQGAWLSVAKCLGCTVQGFDGFAPDDQLMIDRSEFDRRDLEDGVACSFADLALCLEVAEHLPAHSARPLVAGLCEARYVLFSAAHRGQRGLGHVNEQWSSWWVPLFAAHGYVASMDIRLQHWNDQRVQDFYRENMLVFAREDDLNRIGHRVGYLDMVHPQRLGDWP